MSRPPTDPKGYLALVLHAHLPFVRNPDQERFLEESWFYEAVTETYLPLLLTLENLIQDGVDFRLTLSLSPTLVSMLEDELLRRRYGQRLDLLLELASKEVIRQRKNPELLATARFYLDRFTRLKDYYAGRCGCDLNSAFRRMQELGKVELITSAATHAYLPFLKPTPSSVRAQVRVGVEHHRRTFGRDPQGIWLPECAFYPGLDDELYDAGLRYFFLESEGVLRGSTRARYGVHAPVTCPSGVAAFGRDPECSRQVWSAEDGFPGNPDYREFYWDIGFELPLDYVGPYIGPDGIRIHTGIKYHRVTGKTDDKQPYVREWAIHRAAEHAAQFLDWRRHQAEWLRGRMDRTPIIVAPYDAELFGHWWFEGPEWLNFLLRKIAYDQDVITTVTPSEYLAEYPEAQVSTPCASSWGAKGHGDFWLNGSSDWIYPRLHAASKQMARLAFREAGATGLRRRALNQAARELLLAQSSDWPFILKTGTSPGYAASRVEEHLGSFEELVAAVESSEPAAEGAAVSGAAGNGAADPAQGLDLEEPRLRQLEERDNIFPELKFEVFEERIPRPRYAIPDNPRHVVFISAEAVPFVKVGGLADVVGALPASLANLGVRVTIVLPAYASIQRTKHVLRPVLSGLEARLGGRKIPFDLLEAAGTPQGTRVLLVDQPGFFGRQGVYVDPANGEEYPDTAERFVFFTRAALEALRALGEPVDIVHCHDHQTALAPAYLKLHYRKDPVLGLAGSVYTLHNLGYQGVYGPHVLGLAGFGPELFRPGSPFEHAGSVNFMKVGVHFAGKVNTVSEGYAREILEDDSIAAGLEDALRGRSRDFSGILNGIDIEEWNPSRDQFLPEPYGVDDMAGKLAAKRKLLLDSKLATLDAKLDAVGIDAPLVGMITRLVDQKGLDLVHDSLERLLALGIRIVVLGTGLPKYEKFFQDAAARHPHRVAALLKFDNAMAHRIEAGADMFLMPSLYEPCGLNQMYSLRYGTVPIVRETGGLADTVQDDDKTPGGGTGFSFREYRTEGLVDTVARAVAAYRDKERWRRIVRSGMMRDNSWSASAVRYLELYRDALAVRS